jgi:hypothetical protein
VAARVTRRSIVALVALAVAVLIGCARSPAAEQAAPRSAVPTQQQSFSASIATAVSALGSHVGGGYRLVPVTRPYRSAEPPSLAQTPRAVVQVDLGDPDAGYIVVYDLPDSTAAAAAGRELASYLAGGFGQTNYPPDAQFAVSAFGNAVVFAWWSPQRSSAPDRARAAFERIRTFGQPIPVVK